MKTPEEIKKGLAECTRLGGCAACPYFDRGIAARCTPVLAADALAYIQQLEAELAQVKAEYDAAVDDIELGVCCETCKHDNDDDEGAFCVGCVRVTSRGNWEWRGVHENA